MTKSVLDKTDIFTTWPKSQKTFQERVKQDYNRQMTDQIYCLLNMIGMRLPYNMKNMIC